MRVGDICPTPPSIASFGGQAERGLTERFVTNGCSGKVRDTLRSVAENVRKNPQRPLTNAPLSGLA
jgi:hypothetical protein